MPRDLLLIGPWAHASGLGEACRGALRAAWQLGDSWTVQAEAIRHWGPHRRVSPHLSVGDNTLSTLQPDVCWLHMNPDAATACLSDDHRQLLARSNKVVATWVWESQQLPASWHQAMHWLDELWVPSGYVQQLLQPYTHKPVRVLPHVVEPASATDTKASSIKQRQILYIFDGASYLHRKNPEALVEAFALSRLASEGWQLVLKTANLYVAGSDPESTGRLLRRIQDLQADNSSCVRLINQAMPRRDLDALIASSAIYASPHASEGFGLTVAEAMAQGCLVVATDHGGNRDWLNTRTGFPVACELQSLQEGFGAYPAGSVWAKLDIQQLAQGLSAAAHLHDHQTKQALQMREAAQAAIAEQCSLPSVTNKLRSALESLTATP